MERKTLETAFRRLGGIPALARAPGGAKKIVDVFLAESEREARYNIRDLAVTMVDGRHVYTMESSSNPEQHRSEYKDTEELLRMALSVSGLKLVQA